MKISLIFSKRFFKDAKKLKKKYPKIDQDLQVLIDQIEDGKIIGDKMNFVSGLSVYKARVNNSSANSGKRGGFRVIYYTEIKNTVYFITIYSKSAQKKVSSQEILDIIKEEGI